MLIYMQKINFITHFFLKIVQRNSKLVILGNLDKPGHTNQKWQCQFKENFNVYLQAKNKFHPSCFLSDIAKMLQICCFLCFGHILLQRHKKILSASKKLSCLSAGKKPASSPHVFLEILQRYSNFLFWVLLAFLAMSTQILMLSACTKLRCIIACQK